MTQFAVARMHRGQTRFFSGRYAENGTLPLPITTGCPEKARGYDNENVAQLVCVFLNLVASVVTKGTPWAVMPLPEARK